VAAVWAVIALFLLALTGCGEDGGDQAAEDTSASSSPSSSPTKSPASPSASSGAPECAAVWQGDAKLPRSYDGCNSEDGFVSPDKLGCSSGQRMVRYGDHFYAVPGGTIQETDSPLDQDRGYRDAVASCRA
jgi:hypothetical protein